MFHTSVSAIIINHQGCNRKIFLRGQSHFSWFFSRREMLFPVEISILVAQKQIFVILKSEKQNKTKQNKTKQQNQKQNKKKGPLLFRTFPTSIFNFPPSLLQFSSFSSPFPPFPFFLASFFPVGQQKFPGQKSQGHSAPLPPPVTPLSTTHIKHTFGF